MHYEYITYCQVKMDSRQWEEAIRKIPSEIIDQLIQDPRVKGSMYVEYDKKEVVNYLDHLFGIETLRGYKHHHLEINRTEIPKYSHYNILPYQLEWDRKVFGEIVRPTCFCSDACPVGSRLLSPVRIKPKLIRNIGIAEIGRPWGTVRELVISALLKEIFDAEGITGLKYERIVLGDKKQTSESQDSAPYLARITYATHKYADDIHIRSYYCQKHRMPSSYHLLNARIPRDVLCDNDFQVIDKIFVKGQAYRYFRPYLIISRRILEILLDNKIRGLCKRGYFLEQRYLPVIFADESQNGKSMHKKKSEMAGLYQ